MQVRTCHQPIDDQSFATDQPTYAHIQAYDHDPLCIEAATVGEGSALSMQDCSKSTTQMWSSDEAGEIHPWDDSTLCWAVSSAPGEPAAGGGLRRALTLEKCDSVEDQYKLWAVPCGNVGLGGPVKHVPDTGPVIAV